MPHPCAFVRNCHVMLLECLGRDIMAILFNTNGSAINDQTEQQFMASIKRLAVKQRKTVAGVMDMYQSSDQGVLKVKCE